MKRIDAIIRPNRLDAVKDALGALGVTGLTAVEAKGFGRQKGHTEVYRGAEYKIDFQPKTLVTVVVSDELLDLAVNAVMQAARTGVIGDGKLFITALQDVIRIRTGEHQAV
jgi:nitrogen regulatory protein P-II 1